MGTPFRHRIHALALVAAFLVSPLASQVARGQTQEVQEDYFGSAEGYRRICRERCNRLSEWLRAPIDPKAFERPMTFKAFIGTVHGQWAANKMELQVLVDWHAIQEQSKRIAPKSRAAKSLEEFLALRVEFTDLPRPITGAWLLQNAVSQIPPKHVTYFISPVGCIEVTTRTRAVQGQMEMLCGGLAEHFSEPARDAIEYLQWIGGTLMGAKEAVDDVVFRLLGFPTTEE